MGLTLLIRIVEYLSSPSLSKAHLSAQYFHSSFYIIGSYLPQSASSANSVLNYQFSVNALCLLMPSTPSPTDLPAFVPPTLLSRACQPIAGQGSNFCWTFHTFAGHFTFLQDIIYVNSNY